MSPFRIGQRGTPSNWPNFMACQWRLLAQHTFPREAQHTFGAYPKHLQTPRWKESLHKLLVGGPGYVPGVCWKIIRFLWSKICQCCRILFQTVPFRLPHNWNWNGSGELDAVERYDLQLKRICVEHFWKIKRDSDHSFSVSLQNNLLLSEQVFVRLNNSCWVAYWNSWKLTVNLLIFSQSKGFLAINTRTRTTLKEPSNYCNSNASKNKRSVNFIILKKQVCENTFFALHKTY